MNPELQRIRKQPTHATLLALALVGLAAVYLFQQKDIWSEICFCIASDHQKFVFNKSVRLLLNDLLMLAIIHLWFYNSKITRLAFWIQLIDTLILLPAYLILKLTWEGDSEISSPLLSQFHRLIINPTLMILYFLSIYFQRYRKV
ncbi:MAG: hypothetical protein JNM78_19065 [Cyclobacteriaceae bacterium]|nr:hypothetical protein [Cyclobacteriaceae bacterium]